MTAPEKSSDEILEELFGMCTKGRIFKLQDSSQPGSCDEDDDDNNSESDSAKKHKRKKKKKKHKKGKKRKKSASVDDDDDVTETKTSTRRKKSSKQNDSTDAERKYSQTAAFNIKTEKDSEISGSEDTVKKNRTNYTDCVTGQRVTIDDVFGSLGIINDNPFDYIRVKREKQDAVDKAATEKTDGNENISSKTASTASDREQTLPIVNEKNDLTNVFSDGETKSNHAVDKSKPKKINIKNLKNSAVYEATIKEVAEREKLRADKYEEGEISSSSSTSDGSSSFGESLHEKEYAIKSSSDRKKKNHSHKHRKKSKSRNGEKKHCSRSHRRKHRTKTSDRGDHSAFDQNRLRSDSVDSRRDRESRSRHRHRHHLYSSPYSDSRDRRRHHYRHHGSRHRVRSSSGGSCRSDSASRRSRSCRYRTRRRSFDERRSPSAGRKETINRRSKSKSTEKIDKRKLLEIARKNAISMLKQGALPVSVISSKDKIASIKAGGKTVDELTDFCKHLSKKEAEGGDDSVNSGSDVDSENEKQGGPFRHPFLIKERPANIVMNIRNAVSLPTKTAQEKTLELSKQLSLQYPVSSGQQHRKNESEWVPVVKSQESGGVVCRSSVPVYAVNTTANSNISAATAQPLFAVVSCNPVVANSIPQTSAVVPQAIMPALPQNADVGSIVSQRLEAIRRLTENPGDPLPNTSIRAADSKIQFWADSKVQPGLFTGSTGVKPLSVAELSAGCNAWPKKDQFIAAKPVSSDKGEALMKKMGWQPGEGLGKYKQGPSAPCEISLKTDRKGLAEQPQTRTFRQPTLQKAFEINQNKHPVSLLNEYCSRKKIGVPQYDCEEKEGAARKKLYLFAVTVRGIRYTPKMPSMNKKQSKIEAATICLQALGLLPVVPTSTS